MTATLSLRAEGERAAGTFGHPSSSTRSPIAATHPARRPGWPGGRPDRRRRCPTSLPSWHGPFAGRLISRLSIVDRVHVPQGCDHPDIREAGVRLHDRPPSSRTGMHVRREARLVDDHRYGVELSLAPAPTQSSQKNRPDAPYEGLPPTRWMPRTNAKCPQYAGWWAAIRPERRRSCVAWTPGCLSGPPTLVVKTTPRIEDQAPGDSQLLADRWRSRQSDSEPDRSRLRR